MADQDALIIIPARLAATRLPGKPLVDIAGEPMIVHVLRRAQAADAGDVVVATDAEAILACVEKAGGRAVMTRTDHVSGSDRIAEALDAIDPEARYRIVVNVQGDLPTLAPADVRAAVALLADPAVDIGTLAAEIVRPDETTNPNVVKVVGSPIAARAAARALLHPRHRAVGRRPALPPYRALRLSPRSAHALRGAAAVAHSNSASGSNNCARSKPACASMWRSSAACRSASTRPRNWNGRVCCWASGKVQSVD